MLDKEKALEIALAQIEKQFGKGAIMKLGDNSANLNISAIPTGCIDLDIALGVGGIPRGRIVEIFGPESSGKTTIALHVVAQAQKMGGTAAFIDAEHALDPVYAESLGAHIKECKVQILLAGFIGKILVKRYANLLGHIIFTVAKYGAQLLNTAGNFQNFELQSIFRLHRANLPENYWDK